MKHVHLVLIVVISALIFSHPVFAEPVADSSFGYHIISKTSGKCLHVHGGSTSNGGDITQWTCLDQPNVIWKILLVSETASGVYFLKANNSGKCAHVHGGSMDNGGDITQWKCLNQPNLLWDLQEAGNGYFKIKSRKSGKCLQVKDGSTKNGGDIIQWECGNQDKFLWRIRLQDISEMY